jgi:choline dehydrogenase
MGIPIHDDVNGPDAAGAGYINMNIATDGSRASAARAFLRPALSQSNLTLLLDSNVLKVNFTGKRATGSVRHRRRGEGVADKEVILTAGACRREAAHAVRRR